MAGIGVPDDAALEIESRKGQRHEGALLGGTVHQRVQPLEQ